MAMTIDEAIIHAREVAESRDDMCAECRAEHEQLAEWLEELKALRKHDKQIRLDVLKDIAKIIDDYACDRDIKHNVSLGKMINEYIYEQTMYLMERKVGGDNED